MDSDPGSSVPWPARPPFFPERENGTHEISVRWRGKVPPPVCWKGKKGPPFGARVGWPERRSEAQPYLDGADRFVDPPLSGLWKHRKGAKPSTEVQLPVGHLSSGESHEMGTQPDLKEGSIAPQGTSPQKSKGPEECGGCRSSCDQCSPPKRSGPRWSAIPVALAGPPPGFLAPSEFRLASATLGCALDLGYLDGPSVEVNVAGAHFRPPYVPKHPHFCGVQYFQPTVPPSRSESPTRSPCRCAQSAVNRNLFTTCRASLRSSHTNMASMSAPTCPSQKKVTLNPQCEEKGKNYQKCSQRSCC